MNYAHKVADLFGVDIDEVFHTEQHIGTEFKLTATGLSSRTRGSNQNWSLSRSGDTVFCDLIFGLDNIVKIPWKPKDGDIYYYVYTSADMMTTDVCSSTFSTNWDIAQRAFGNCFQTREEAEAHKGEVVDRMKEEI